MPLTRSQTKRQESPANMEHATKRIKLEAQRPREESQPQPGPSRASNSLLQPRILVQPAPQEEPRQEPEPEPEPESSSDTQSSSESEPNSEPEMEPQPIPLVEPQPAQEPQPPQQSQSSGWGPTQAGYTNRPEVVCYCYNCVYGHQQEQIINVADYQSESTVDLHVGSAAIMRQVQWDSVTNVTGCPAPVNMDGMLRATSLMTGFGQRLLEIAGSFTILANRSVVTLQDMDEAFNHLLNRSRQLISFTSFHVNPNGRVQRNNNH